MFFQINFIRSVEKAFSMRGLKPALMCGSAIALVLGAAPVSVQAQTWTYGHTNSNWDEPNNWDTHVVPNDDTATAVLPNLNPGDVDTIYLNTAITLNSLEIKDAYTLSVEDKLTFGGTTPQMQITLDPASNASITSTGTGTVVLAADTNVIVNGAGGTLTIGAVISDSGGLTKSGDGKLVLTNANTYSGSTVVEGGELALTGSGAIASTDVQIDGGKLTSDGGALAAAAQITNAAGEFVLTAGAAESVRSLTGAGANMLGGRLSLTDGASAISGVISGAGGLDVAGGAVVLSGAANINTGDTILTDGSLTVTNGDQLGAGVLQLASTSGAKFVGNGTFTLANAIKVTGSETVIAVTTGNTMTLTAANPGGLAIAAGSGLVIGDIGVSGDDSRVILAPDAAVTVGAGAKLNVAVGTLQLGTTHAAAALTTMGVTVDATLDLAGNNTTMATLAGAGAVTNSGAVSSTVTVSGVGGTTFSGVISNGAGTGTLGLTLNNTAAAGTLTLSGTNTYTGATTITKGVLEVQGDDAIADTGLVNRHNS